MNFFNPLAFIGLITVPIIIIMYILKQKHKQIEFSSIQLWNKAILNSKSQKPWQKLRKNLLMILQILIAILLVLAMSKPFIMDIEKIHNYIIVLDSSMSMQALDESPNRFQYAKENINNFVDNVTPNSSISIVVMNNNPYIALNASQNKTTVKNVINDIKIGASNVDTDMTTSLLKMMYEENQSTIYVFSDDIYKFGELNTQNIMVGKSLQNTSVTLVSHSLDNEKTSVLVKVKNHYNQAVEQTVSLYIDGLIYDTKPINLNQYEQKDIIFDNLTVNGTNLEARIEEKDILPIDDKGFDIISENRNKKVLLLTENNIFLEKALSILDINLYKGDINNINDLTNYDLYIFDGVLPENLPNDGHILIINPPNDNNIIPVTGQSEVKTITVKDKKLLQFATNIDFSVSEAKIIETPKWANVIIDSDVSPLILSGDINGQKNVIFNFDLHNTDLPLKKEFPIFMYNIINWYMPEKITNNQNIFVGDTIEFNLKPNIDKATILTPYGDIIDIVPPFPASPFSKTLYSGIYTLEQILGENSEYSNFAVNTILDESDLTRENKYLDNKIDNNITQGNKNIANIFILILLGILVIEWLVYHHYNKYDSLFKKRLITITKIIIIILVISSLFSIQLRKYTNETTTIFAVDLSDSMNGNTESIENFISKSLKNKNDNDSIGIVGFGKYATVQNNVSKQLDIQPFDLQIDTSSTDIETGLKLSSVIIPENSYKTIVLLSDGQENLGDLLRQAKLLKQQNIKLDVYNIKNSINNESQITQLSLPKYINKGSKFDIEVKIDSLNDTSSVLKLYKDNTIISKENVLLYKGENKFIFNDIADIGGSIVYKAELEPENDTFRQNNIVYSYSYITDIPKILILENNNSGIEIEKILNNSGLDITRKNALFAPNIIDELLYYNSIILSDVNINLLPENFPSILESYVKSGGGLVVTGGINSYALGGYNDTILEKILPVDMELKDTSKEADLGMIIVTDRSGSMDTSEYGISKLSLAKEAIIRATNTVESKDSIGVIAFDDKPEWIVELQKVEDNKQNIENKIASITLGGGTSILPALNLACDTLVNYDAKLKHIILMTDGQAETTGYDNIIAKMLENNITLSTVAIGTNSDTTLLNKLADKGNGRYYYSNVFTDLPEIFAKESFIAGKSYINEREFYPKVSYYPSITDDIKQIPTLKGYIASSEKPRANVILKSDKDDPILAIWQYGLGKSVAWTSNMDGGWSSNWLTSEQGIDIFKNTVSWTLKNQKTEDVILNVNKEANTNTIEALISSNDIKSVKATILNPDMKEYDIEFKTTQPEVYKADFNDDTIGIYIVNIIIEKQNGEIDIVNSTININYSQEYDIRNFNLGSTLLKKASEITGGRILNSYEEVFNITENKTYDKKDISVSLLVIALILLILEITLIRFSIISSHIELTANNISFILKNRNKKTNKIDISKNDVKENKISTTSSKLVLNKKKRMGR